MIPTLVDFLNTLANTVISTQEQVRTYICVNLTLEDMLAVGIYSIQDSMYVRIIMTVKLYLLCIFTWLNAAP